MKTNVLKFTGILLLLTGVFYSCKDNNVYLGTAKCGKFNITETEFVSWCIVPYEVTRNSVNVARLENRTENMLRYGAPFYLEHFNGNSWTPVRLDDVKWVGVEYGLFPNEVSENSIFLYSLISEFNRGRKGKYRIIRRYSMHEGFHPNFPWGEYIRSIDLYTEFIIK